MSNIIHVAAGSAPVPDIYDDFSDGKYQNRNGVDPWGRPLPEWFVEDGAIDASNGYIKAKSINLEDATLSIPTDITKGTWIYKYKYLSGTPLVTGNNYLISIITKYLNPSNGDTLQLGNPVDGHWWLDFLHNGRVPQDGYIVNMAGSQIDERLVGGNDWHEVVFIKDENGYVYTWLDGNYVRWSLDKTDDIQDSTKFTINFRDVSSTPLKYPIAIDNVQIYKDKYLPPVNSIVYNSSLNSIVIKGFGADLRKIAAEINNPDIFSYDSSTNTAISYKDITLGSGSELRIENGKLLMASSYDGERKINYYTDPLIYIYNSTVTSTDNHYFLWQRLSDKDKNFKGVFKVINSTVDNTGNIFFERPVAFYIENSKFTNMVNELTVYFRWPTKELKIKNSRFEGKTGKEKINLIGGDQFGQLTPKPVGMDIIDSDFSKVTLACVQDAPYYLSPDNPGCTANIINTKLGPVSYSGTTLRNKLYLDVKVVDSNGIQVSNANVDTVNEIDKNHPAENLLQGKKYFQILNQVSPAGKPYFSGQTSNWFKGWADGNDHTSSITGVDGHISLPSDSSNTMVLTSQESRDSGVSSYSYGVTASKDGSSSSLSNIIPDSGWYRADMDDPTYTITAIIPDSSSGLHLTGFAPSESNPFPVGQSKNFVIWTDQSLTKMNWYLDSTPVASDTMKYNWTASSGSHTIRFEGSNANGIVSQQWEISEGSRIRTAPESTPIPTPEVSPTTTPSSTPIPTVTPANTPSSGSTLKSANVFDNRMREVSPDVVFSGSSYLDIGQISGSSRYRDVLSFDLSAYNKTDKITNAVLSLFWYYPSLARSKSTTIEIYRPLAWDLNAVNWNNRSYGTPWNSPGGDWFDRNNEAYGSAPFASITFDANTLADNRYYSFDVTELVQSYVNGTYDNTGFFLKAKDENDNYIAFYSSDWKNASQRPRLDISQVTDAASPSDVNADVNLDGTVDQSDLDIIAQHFGEVITTPNQRYNVNNDGIVDIFDLTIVSNNIK